MIVLFLYQWIFCLTDSLFWESLNNLQTSTMTPVLVRAHSAMLPLNSSWIILLSWKKNSTIFSPQMWSTLAGPSLTPLLLLIYGLLGSPGSCSPCLIGSNTFYQVTLMIAITYLKSSHKDTQQSCTHCKKLRGISQSTVVMKNPFKQILHYSAL